jgi:hypothetical protein
VTKHDERVRASHAAFDGVTLPIDDPFWNSHTPPLGYRCRSRLVTVNQRDYDKGTTPTGGAMRKTAPNLGTRVKAVDKNSLIYVQVKESAELGGYVLVVKATQTGNGLFVSSYRRLSRKEALRDKEIARLVE